MAMAGDGSTLPGSICPDPAVLQNLLDMKWKSQKGHSGTANDGIAFI
jgi:hypothetical protein